MKPLDKPMAPACERNQGPILDVLCTAFADRRRVLEIGSGTGQHAVHFAAALPWLTWQCSDVAGNLPGIGMWLDDAGLANTASAIELEVMRGPWPDTSFDAVFSANAVHIMGWPDVEALFAGLDGVLDSDARLVLYGPFNYDGEYSSHSNREFDGWLKARDPRSAIRDFEAVAALARAIGLQLVDDIAMPANNRCLVWQR